MLRRILLGCGAASSLLYITMNVIGAMHYPGYSSVSQTVSELSAIGAPTRPLWVVLGAIYEILLIAFGLGVWRSAGANRPLRVAGALIVSYGAFGLAWPPMHQRTVLGAGGGTLTDTLHIVWAVVTVLFMLLFIGFGAAAFGKPFRVYSIGTVFVLLLFGTLAGLDGPRIGANLPTPWVGVWERLSIFAYLLWLAVLAIVLSRAGEADAQLHSGRQRVLPAISRIPER